VCKNRSVQEWGNPRIIPPLRNRPMVQGGVCQGISEQGRRHVVVIEWYQKPVSEKV
jgi:hypothetical protein